MSSATARFQLAGTVHTNGRASSSLAGAWSAMFFSGSSSRVTGATTVPDIREQKVPGAANAPVRIAFSITTSLAEIGFASPGMVIVPRDSTKRPEGETGTDVFEIVVPIVCVLLTVVEADRRGVRSIFVIVREDESYETVA